MLAPGRADAVMQTALAVQGSGIEEPLVLMAWRPFRQLEQLSAEDLVFCRPAAAVISDRSTVARISAPFAADGNQ